MPDLCSSITHMYEIGSLYLRPRYTRNFPHTFQICLCACSFSGIVSGLSVSVRKRSSPFSPAALSISFLNCHAIRGPHSGQLQRLQYSLLYTNFSFPASSLTLVHIAFFPHALLYLGFFISSEEDNTPTLPTAPTPFSSGSLARSSTQSCPATARLVAPHLQQKQRLQLCPTYPTG
jgi:hypothetical protein